MITKVENVGYSVYGETLGELWLDMVETILKNGQFELDENRGRFAVRNLRFAAGIANPDDKLIEKYGDKAKIDAMKNVVFNSDTMKDFDITPSFRNGAKSYKKRLEEGKMMEFVIERLAKIPESKKAVMVFPTYEDYIAVLNSPWKVSSLPMPAPDLSLFVLPVTASGRLRFTSFSARGFEGSFSRYPSFTSIAMDLWAVEVDLISIAVHISRTVGGYPFARISLLIKSNIRCSRSFNLLMESSAPPLALIVVEEFLPL